MSKLEDTTNLPKLQLNSQDDQINRKILTQQTNIVSNLNISSALNIKNQKNIKDVENLDFDMLDKKNQEIMDIVNNKQELKIDNPQHKRERSFALPEVTPSVLDDYKRQYQNGNFDKTSNLHVNSNKDGNSKNTTKITFNTQKWSNRASQLKQRNIIAVKRISKAQSRLSNMNINIAQVNQNQTGIGINYGTDNSLTQQNSKSSLHLSPNLKQNDKMQNLPYFHKRNMSEEQLRPSFIQIEDHNDQNILNLQFWNDKIETNVVRHNSPPADSKSLKTTHQLNKAKINLMPTLLNMKQNNENSSSSASKYLIHKFKQRLQENQEIILRSSKSLEDLEKAEKFTNLQYLNIKDGKELHVASLKQKEFLAQRRNHLHLPKTLLSEESENQLLKLGAKQNENIKKQNKDEQNLPKIYQRKPLNKHQKKPPLNPNFTASRPDQLTSIKNILEIMKIKKKKERKYTSSHDNQHTVIIQSDQSQNSPVLNLVPLDVLQSRKSASSLDNTFHSPNIPFQQSIVLDQSQIPIEQIDYQYSPPKKSPGINEYYERFKNGQSQMSDYMSNHQHLDLNLRQISRNGHQKVQGSDFTLSIDEKIDESPNQLSQRLRNHLNNSQNMIISNKKEPQYFNFKNSQPNSILNSPLPLKLRHYNQNSDDINQKQSNQNTQGNMSNISDTKSMKEQQEFDDIMRKTRINIKKLMRDNSEDKLSQMCENRQKMLRLVFKKDFQGLKKEIGKQPDQKRLLRLNPKTHSEVIRDLAMFSTINDTQKSNDKIIKTVNLFN
eukprot:403377540